MSCTDSLALSTLTLHVSLALDTFALTLDHEFPLTGVSALFGPSGSGKTTLLRVISGLESRARGTVSFDGEIWQETGSGRFLPPHRRGVGYVFQDARLFPFLDVHRNLQYAEKRSWSQGTSIKFDDVVSALDVSNLLKRRPASLSGGERQRVAIARTLLTRPRLLLMDEPLAALDLRRKAEILPYIEKLPDSFGVPIIYVTHSIDEVVRLAERVVVLTAGTKLADGGVTETLQRQDLQAAIGHFEAGVVVDATIKAHDQRYQVTQLELAGQTIIMPMIEAPKGTQLRLRIRARDVSIALEQPKQISVRNILSGSIQEVEEEADTAFAELAIDIGQVRLRSRITRQAVADLQLEIGKPVYALIKSIAFDRRILKRTQQ